MSGRISQPGQTEPSFSGAQPAGLGPRSPSLGGRRRLCLVLIKPSHYDDDGYVIQWYRSAIPSNSLAVLYGLAKTCAEQKSLGEDIELEIHGFDETNTRIDAGRIAALIGGADIGLVMLVGVQSNQFPRALDIARPLRFEQPRFSCRVLREGMVSVQMILRDIERDRGLGAELANGLELEAGELEHVPAIVA